MRQEQLVEAIDNKRDEMIQLGMAKGLLNDETIKCSQELDHMLNEFGRLSDDERSNHYFYDYKKSLYSLSKSTYKFFWLGCSSFFHYFQHNS